MFNVNVCFHNLIITINNLIYNVFMFIYVIQSQHDLQVCSVVAVGTPDYISPEILMAMNDGQGFLSCLLIPPPHPASSSRLLIPPPHPASSSRLLIPPPHLASSSRLLIPPPHPASSSRLLIPPPQPASSSLFRISSTPHFFMARLTVYISL